MSSTSEDPRGNPVGTRSPQAQEAAERALAQLMSFDGPAHPALDAAIAADPDWLLPHVMKAGAWLATLDGADLASARATVDGVLARGLDGPPRERAHLAAVQQAMEGRWDAACDSWDELLLAHPRDALALHWSHQWDWLRGDATSLRARPARALPEWDDHDPLLPHVLGLYAFGLQACHLSPQAEEVARRALADGAVVPVAVCAVAEAMQVQGRFEDGAAWLRQHQPMWADGNGLGTHLWWQAALFRLEAMDDAGVLRLVDKHFTGEALSSPFPRMDAAALLWRLHLLGVDVSARWRELAEGWPVDDEDAGRCALHDLHVLLALAGAGDAARADRWLARCAERAMQAEDARRSNHAVARELGIPLMRAVLAQVRGESSAAARALYPLRRIAHRLGGSHTHRDLIDQTLLAASADGDEPALGRAVLNERRMAKPVTPLTRHWSQRLDPAAR